jgi:hypothetical protein
MAELLIVPATHTLYKAIILLFQLLAPSDASKLDSISSLLRAKVPQAAGCMVRPYNARDEVGLSPLYDSSRPGVRERLGFVTSRICADFGCELPDLSLAKDLVYWNLDDHDGESLHIIGIAWMTNGRILCFTGFFCLR